MPLTQSPVGWQSDRFTRESRVSQLTPPSAQRSQRLWRPLAVARARTCALRPQVVTITITIVTILSFCCSLSVWLAHSSRNGSTHEAFARCPRGVPPPALPTAPTPPSSRRTLPPSLPPRPSPCGAVRVGGCPLPSALYGMVCCAVVCAMGWEGRNGYRCALLWMH